MRRARSGKIRVQLLLPKELPDMPTPSPGRTCPSAPSTPPTPPAAARASATSACSGARAAGPTLPRRLGARHRRAVPVPARPRRARRRQRPPLGAERMDEAELDAPPGRLGGRLRPRGLARVAARARCSDLPSRTARPSRPRRFRRGRALACAAAAAARPAGSPSSGASRLRSRRYGASERGGMRCEVGRDLLARLEHVAGPAEVHARVAALRAALAVARARRACRRA